ncbi:hypothetical protein BGZ61DRAFT_589449 [Ilyonectria robusta]|uniref:uncharacterized protein n=1 Tax=Ilyonectria robusta TaxID=1079257 RepID=UPI001E8EA984|nr:uncharacterized protein BGZ61DRAFT_589449 [Ilyonectria robusta]KAH8686181.1 hypothetical protein BGZ61DRAFT_589449 [Ilyonectria robusta]
MAEVLRKRNIFLLAYDVTDRNTFDYIKKFHPEVFGADQDGKPILVCAGKSERPEEDWAVSAQEAEEFSTTIGARFMKYSGRTGYGLDDDFARHIAANALLDLAGVNYRGPNKILQVRSVPKRWRLHLGAICEKVRNCFRNPSK